MIFGGERDTARARTFHYCRLSTAFKNAPVMDNHESELRLKECQGFDAQPVGAALSVAFVALQVVGPRRLYRRSYDCNWWFRTGGCRC